MAEANRLWSAARRMQKEGLRGPRLVHGGMFTGEAFGLPSTLARVEERGAGARKTATSRKTEGVQL